RSYPYQGTGGGAGGDKEVNLVVNYRKYRTSRSGRRRPRCRLSLYRERQDHLQALRQAVGGLEGARVTLAKALQRIRAGRGAGTPTPPPRGRGRGAGAGGDCPGGGGRRHRPRTTLPGRGPAARPPSNDERTSPTAPSNPSIRSARASSWPP